MKKMIAGAALAALFAGVTAGCCCCATPAKSEAKTSAPKSSERMDRTKLQIGVYCYGYDWLMDEAHVKAVKDCGINFIIGFPRGDKRNPTLDILQKYGLGCVVSGALPGWWGGNGERAGKMREINTIDKYAFELDIFKKQFDHPAIWMIDLCDEPSAKDMEYLGELCALIREKCPETPAYLNLYPNYAVGTQNSSKQVVDQLGTNTYQEHIDVYNKTVPLDYLSYDHYMYMDTPEKTASWIHRMYDNYRIVADTCRKSGRDFWYIPQVNTRPECNLKMTENKLRYQAFTAMAFGATAINWACWTPGWWKNNIYDKEGKRDDELYNRLKQVNSELRYIGPYYMKFRNVSTHFVNFEGGDKTYEGGSVRHLKATDDSPVLVGEMAPREPGVCNQALFVVAPGDPMDLNNQEHTISFTAFGRVRAIGNKGPVELKKTLKDTYTFTIRDNDCVLVMIASDKGAQK